MTEGAPPWSAQFSLAELEAVVAEAHRLGKRVAAHAHGRLGITQAVAAQVDTIEHKGDHGTVFGRRADHRGHRCWHR
jgi:imidazolonepropionase-like amidohydrolase